MSTVHAIERCQQRFNAIRKENHAVRKFIPEKEFRDVVSKELISSIVSTFVPHYNHDEVLEFVLEDAPKVFAILVLINHIDCIFRFIRQDQLQTRHVDSLLPFSEARLQEILADDYLAGLFHEKQWEFCAPVFSGRIIPRTLDRQTILPFLQETFLVAGRYGQVYKLDIHPSHRPPSFEGTVYVRQILPLMEPLLI